MSTITVKRIATKEVTTRYGDKPVYSVQSEDGAWYKHGFKKPPFKEGDTVDVDVKETPYGPEITSSKVVSSGTGAAPAPRTTGTGVGGGGGGGYGGKVFPVPALHGDRSIIRQNSLTNARETWVASKGGEPFTIDEFTAHTIIDIARIFESYSCGDIDLAVAKRMASDDGVDVEDII